MLSIFTYQALVAEKKRHNYGDFAWDMDTRVTERC